jgi:hypothetical protein
VQDSSSAAAVWSRTDGADLLPIVPTTARFTPMDHISVFLRVFEADRSRWRP